MSDGAEFEQLNAVAIIGMACRFPGADSVIAFWRNLQAGVESITFFSDQELEAAGVVPEVLGVANYIKAKPVLDAIELFDASFFKISPREAISIDPQHRLFLECAWEALEHAGYNPEVYPGQIGVYAGTQMNSYLLHNLLAHRDFMVSLGGIQFATASDKDYLSTRVSHKLNLRGPSITVQTACSTSLVAVHLAFQSLLIGESDMVLAGGVTVTVPHRVGYFYEEGGVFSADGHCRAFDAKARGTVYGSGAGVVVLKRLADAVKDGDHIHAVIKGSAVNNDGAFKLGYTAPSVSGQAAVITEALSVAGVEPETIGYVEAHGTGTELGDSIEVAALTQAFRLSTEKNSFCALGSVKTNVGHLAAAAGVASLIKTVQALEHKQIPASLNFEQPNPQIDFANTPFYVNTKLRDWPANGTPRRAGVSSFGMGGTNAHVVLEEAPPSAPSGGSHRYQLLALSARTATALEHMTERLAASMHDRPEIPLADVAYTLLVGRARFEHCRVFVCKTLPEAIAALQERDPIHVFTGVRGNADRPVVFMFPGSGAQYVDMGRGLYASEPVFRATVDRCVTLLHPYLGFDLREVLYPGQGSGVRGQGSGNHDHRFLRSPDPRSLIPDPSTVYAQLALFVVEYALATLWQTWGLQPAAMIGHSVGEYVAACLAGVLSLEDALALLVSFERHISQVQFRSPRLPYISSVTGDWIKPEEATNPDYWVAQLRQPDRRAQGVSSLMKDADQVLLEVGPGHAWCDCVHRQPQASPEHVVLASLCGPDESQPDDASLLTALGQLWVAGVNVDWEAFYNEEHRLRVPLPTYPFERERYWLPSEQAMGE